MKKKLKVLVRKIYMNILAMLPKEIAHKIYFKKQMGYSLDFKKVQNFNEKLQYLIVKEFSERETNLADKYLVREYVEKKCGKEILPKLFAVYLSTSEINLQDLPKQFVLKTNNGCGNVFICHNKDKFNINECKKKVMISHD